MNKLIVFLLLLAFNTTATAGTWEYKVEKTKKVASYITDNEDVLALHLQQDKSTKKDKASKDEVTLFLYLPKNNNCYTSIQSYDSRFLKYSDSSICKIFIHHQKLGLTSETLLLYSMSEDKKFDIFKLIGSISSVIIDLLIKDNMETKKQLVLQIPYEKIGYKMVKIDFSEPIKKDFFK